MYCEAGFRVIVLGKKTLTFMFHTWKGFTDLDSTIYTNAMSLDYEISISPVAITVSFSQTTYSVDEDDGPAQPVLVLSNPSSTDITVQVRDTENTATSE